MRSPANSVRIGLSLSLAGPTHLCWNAAARMASVFRVPAIRDSCRATCLTHISEETVPKRHRQSIAPHYHPWPSVCPEIAIDGSSDSRLSLNHGWAQRLVRPPGVASYLQIQSDTAAYAVKTSSAVPEVNKSWRPSNRPLPPLSLSYHPDGIHQQRLWCRGGSNCCSVGQ